MSRTRKAKTTFRWYKWFLKHMKHKNLRKESKDRVESGINQAFDGWHGYGR